MFWTSNVLDPELGGLAGRRNPVDADWRLSPGLSTLTVRAASHNLTEQLGLFQGLSIFR